MRNILPRINSISFFPILFMAFVLLGVFSLPSMAGDDPRVLIIHSYHRGYEWTDSLHREIVSAISGEMPETDFYVEYMDTKRFFSHGFLFDLAWLSVNEKGRKGGVNLVDRPAQTMSRWAIVAALLLTAIGMGVRLYGLGTQSQWIDEIYSHRVAELPLGEIVGARPASKPPLDYWFQHIAMQLLGDSASAQRLPAALFGGLTSFAIFGLISASGPSPISSTISWRVMPTWGAARPMPLSSYMVSSISVASCTTSSSTVSIRSHFLRRIEFG